MVRRDPRPTLTAGFSGPPAGRCLKGVLPPWRSSCRRDSPEHDPGCRRLTARRAGPENREPARLAGFDSLAFRTISPASTHRTTGRKVQVRVTSTYNGEVARFDSSPVLVVPSGR